MLFRLTLGKSQHRDATALINEFTVLQHYLCVALDTFAAQKVQYMFAVLPGHETHIKRTGTRHWRIKTRYIVKRVNLFYGVISTALIFLSFYTHSSSR